MKTSNGSSNKLKLSIQFNSPEFEGKDPVILSAFHKKAEAKKGAKKKEATGEVQNNHWPKEYKEIFSTLSAAENFSGKKGESFTFYDQNGRTLYVTGLGEKAKVDLEVLRRQIATAYKAVSKSYKKVIVDVDGFLHKKDYEGSLTALSESLMMTAYNFDKHKSKQKPAKLEEIVFATKEKKTTAKAMEKGLENGLSIGESINIARDFVNEPPNVLNSVSYAKMVEKDAAKLKRVKVKVLGKPELKKEKMGLFLSVNNASAHDARLVHLTYTPAKSNKNTKHIVLVGKGLTFDTGGYSLKPSASMINMKFDMAGSATVYGAFRAAAMLGVNAKITCILGLTDNAVNNVATMPDAVFTARNGKTVEILNTDAEGRLVLADCLDYACDLKPDAIIDAATLTGACLMALGTEICAVMSNNDKLVGDLKKSAKAQDEYLWELPIVDEFREDIKSNVADLKNIAGSRFAGTTKAGAFLEEFIQEGVAWAHLDIAGVADSQSHLPYCPSKGASGIMIRTLVNYMSQVK